MGLVENTVVKTPIKNNGIIWILRKFALAEFQYFNFKRKVDQGGSQIHICRKKQLRCVYDKIAVASHIDPNEKST